MKHIKKSLLMIRYNLKTLIEFEFLFKIVSIFLFVPLFVHFFDSIMKIRGYEFLTLENIVSFLLNPLTFLLLLILILLMMIYTMFDITTIILILDCSYHKQKITIVDAVRLSLEKCKTMFKIKNISLAILILFLIPFLNIGISSSFISVIQIPEFIVESIEKNKIFLILFFCLFFLLFFILLKWLYAIHYYILENVSFKEARKRSSKLGHKNHIKDWLIIVIVQSIFVLFFLLFIVFGIFFLFFIHSITNILLKSFLTTIISYFIAISFLVFTLLATPISYASISSLYYIRKEKRQEKAIAFLALANDKNEKKNKTLRKIWIGIVIFTIGIGTFFTYGLYKGKYDLTIEYPRKIEITAHRGASKNYPENTMKSFIEAKNLGADFIELDVQETKDHEIIVMHDKNLKRTTGVNKFVWEMTWEEMKTLDAGSYLNPEFKEERIPLLKDVIKWAKENNIKLNIELKPTGKEEYFEREVVTIIKELDYIENSYIASQVYSVLETTKKIAPEIKTIYVMSVFYGDIETFSCADYFSIEISNINQKLVYNIHKKGKEIYAWTMNTEENMKKMLELKVDNLITDDISLAKKVIVESGKSNLIYEYIKWIEKIFR